MDIRPEFDCLWTASVLALNVGALVLDLWDRGLRDTAPRELELLEDAKPESVEDDFDLCDADDIDEFDPGVRGEVALVVREEPPRNLLLIEPKTPRLLASTFEFASTVGEVASVAIGMGL